MIEVCDMSPFPAGDLPEFLTCTLAAVGLQTTTQGQMLIAPMAQRFAAPDPARADGGKLVFPDVHSYNWTGCHEFAVGRLNDEIERPATPVKDQFPLLWRTAL
jgi:hypothetical protein